MQKHGATLTIFRLTLTTVIFIESLLTVVHSLHSATESHLGALLPWFAGVEALAAISLLFRRTVLAGGSILLVIFMAALVILGPADQMHLFVYAAGVILLMSGRTADTAVHDR